MNALIINEMQNDLCNPGPFYHQNSLEIIPTINRIKDNFKISIYVQNIYPKNHLTFQRLQTSCIKEYCIQDTTGSEIHPFLNVTSNDFFIKKSTLQSYESSSAFFNAEVINKQTDLLKILKSKNIVELYFCGNCFETSIFSTIIDAIKYKFKCFVVANGLSFLDSNSFEKCKKFLLANDVIFLNL